jgi:predicted SprT family Zn-dependent metalloprotease
VILSDARKLALSLMDQHNLLQGGWTFSFMDRASVCGLCRHTRRQIQLSVYYVEHNADSDIRNTILHEIAHAICPEHGHGRQWKLTAMSVGARPETCARPEIIVKPGRYQGTCEDCQKVVVHRYKISPRITRGCRHRPCRGRLNGGNVVWTDVQTGRKVGA